MPYVDVLNESVATLTDNDGEAQNGTIIDFGGVRELGTGTPLQMRVVVEVLPVVATTNTMTLALVMADNAALSTNAVTVATMVSAAAPPAAGTTFLVPFPLGDVKRYMGLVFTPADTRAFTAGRVRGFVEPHLG